MNTYAYIAYNGENTPNRTSFTKNEKHTLSYKIAFLEKTLKELFSLSNSLVDALGEFTSIKKMIEAAQDNCESDMGAMCSVTLEDYEWSNTEYDIAVGEPKHFLYVTGGGLHLEVNIEKGMIIVSHYTSIKQTLVNQLIAKGWLTGATKSQGNGWWSLVAIDCSFLHLFTALKFHVAGNKNIGALNVHYGNLCYAPLYAMPNNFTNEQVEFVKRKVIYSGIDVVYEQ